LTDRREALIALLDSAGPRLLALLSRLTLREDVAEDLHQELFLKLGRSEGFFNATEREGYAVRAAINLAFDWRRQRKSKPPPEPLPDQIVGGESTPLEHLVNRERLEQLLDALHGLNATYREVFVMHHLQQESHKTIALHLGKTPHQVRALCHKAVQQLRQKLKED
jgi:RNA polymerase sigma factor (sigma-70 family)